MATKTREQLDAERPKIKTKAELDAGRTNIKSKAELDAGRNNGGYTGDKKKDVVTFRSNIAGKDRAEYETEYKKYASAIADKPSGNKLVDTLNRVSQTGANFFTGSTAREHNYRKPISTGNKALDIGSDFVGGTLGILGGSKALGNLAGSSKGIIGEGYELSGRLLPKASKIASPAYAKIVPSLSPKVASALPKIGEHLFRGAIPGTAIDVTQGLKEQDSVGDLGKRVARGAAFGAVIDLAGYGLSQSVLKAMSKSQVDNAIESIAKSESMPAEQVKQEVDRMLLLPAGKEPFKKRVYKGPENPILDDVMKEYEKRLESGKWLLDRKVPEARNNIKGTINDFELKISKAENATPQEIEAYIKSNRQNDFKEVFGEPKATFKTQLEVPQVRKGVGTLDDPFRWENEQAIKSIPPPKETPLKPIDTISRVLTENPKSFKTSLSDRYERVYQEIFSTKVPFEKMGGVARTQGSNLNRIQGTIEYNTVGKQVDMQGDEIGKSIVDIFSDTPKESKKKLFDYTLNIHNIDRFREGKPVFGENITSEMSAAKVAEYDKINPEFKGKQQEITKYFKNLMDEWAVKSGLVSKETADMLDARYTNYVPTYRAKDLPKSMMQFDQNVSQMIRKAKGSEDFILPIDQQMIAMTERTVKNARKNELMNTIADAFEAGDSNASRYIKEIKGLPKESIDNLIDVGRYFDEVPVLKGNEYAVNFYTNGEPRQMLVNKTLYKALDDSVSDNAMNAVASVVKKYATQPFKNLITGYNPLFAASNITRDVPTALTYSSNPLKMSANVPRAMKEMLTNGPLYRKFKAMGGTREGLIGSGKEFKVPNLNETNKAFKMAQKANPIKKVGDINNFTETLPRFSEFLTVLDKTNNPALAIYKSAELTTDFSRNGKLIKYLDNYVPYLNPSVQGLNKFFRGIKESPLKTISKGATVITVPTIILDQINKDNDNYNNLSPRERNLYFNVPIPDSEEFLRIPKSRELGVVFSSMYEWAARKSRGQEVTGEEIAQAIGENFTPTDVTAPIWTSAQKAWRQIKNPDAYETNYWGGLIVPTSQRQYSPGQQYDMNSSGIAKAIGEQFNVSPFVVDYFIKSYGGIIGQEIQPIGAGTTTNLFEALTIEPWKNKFINDPVFKSDSVNKFYEELDKAKKKAQDYNKKNNIESKIVTPLEKEVSALNKLASSMSELRKEQKELKVIKGNEYKIKALQVEINKIAERESR